jgi:hypothetical protein
VRPVVKWGSVNRLVSSSGFTADALALAEFYGIQAITPGLATPEFIGQVVNNLSSVWTKLAHVTPNRMQLWVQWPEGDVEVVDATDNMGIYHPDGTHICTGNDLLKTAMQHYNPNDPAFRDATGEETFFEMGQTEPRFKGEPM